MKHLFVPYNIALELKEKGFDESCFSWYLNKKLETGPNEIFWFTHSYRSHPKQEFVSAPLYQQVIDFFREKYHLHFYIETTPSFDKTQGNKFKVSIKFCFKPFKWTTGHYYLGDTYYKALDKAIQEALKLI